MLQKSVISSIFQKLPALVQPRLYLFRYKWPFPIGRVLETNDAACSATFYQLINIQGQFWFLLLDKSADPKFICNFLFGEWFDDCFLGFGKLEQICFKF